MLGLGASVQPGSAAQGLFVLRMGSGAATLKTKPCGNLRAVSRSLGALIQSSVSRLFSELIVLFSMNLSYSKSVLDIYTSLKLGEQMNVAAATQAELDSSNAPSVQFLHPS